MIGLAIPKQNQAEAMKESRIILPNELSPSRRAFLTKAMLGSAALFTAPGAFAELLELTPRQTEGPFYPDKMPLDTDNDLIILNDKITPAVGEVSYLHGKVTDAKGTPIPNALVEIWQVDNNAAYLHTRDPNRKKADANFQGYGRFSTNLKGEYFFRTIKPVPYPGRTPHIHVKVSHKGKHLLTTQCYVKGHANNARDGLFRSLGKSTELLEVAFLPLKDSKTGELTAKFDIIVGTTPEDKH